MTAPQTLLDGLKVVTMAEQFPGPYCTMLLADMGAEIIMVERPGMGDPSRFLPPFFEALNRGKQSVALNVKDPGDYEKLMSLIEDADIFLEGFRPGKLEKADMGYKALSAVNPRLIYASITGYGQTGPYRDRPGHDLSYQGIGGALFEQLNGGGAPPNILLGDLGAAVFATIGVLAALQARHRTGRGAYIDVGMSDCVAALMAAPIAMAMNGGAHLPAPSSEPGYDIFETSDGKKLTISIAHEDNFWSRLCGALGLEIYADLPRQERVEKRAALSTEIRKVIKTRPYDDWERIFTETDQMFGPAYDRDEVASDPHIVARELFETLTHADGRIQTVMRQPLKFHGFDNAPLSPSPALDEHGADYFSETDAK